MSWEPLASSDPVPGDPGRVATVAEQLTEIANAIGEQTGRLRGVTAEAFWEGDAADRFEADKDDLPPLLDLVQRRYGEVGSALARYAPELAAAQELARRALSQARSAEADIASAERGIDRMDEYAQGERARVRSLAAAYPDRSPPRPVPWSGPNYRMLLGDAQADLAAARALLDQAVDQNVRAAHTAASTIYDAIHDDIRNSFRSRAQAAAGWIAENFPIQELSAILGVLAAIAGVIALFFPPAGIVALALGGAKLLLDAVLWAASDFDAGRGWRLLAEGVLLALSAGVLMVVARAGTAATLATRAMQAEPSATNAIAAARALRFAQRAEAFDRGFGIGGVMNDAQDAADPSSDLFGDIRLTADIYRSQTLAWHLPGMVLGPAGIAPGIVGAAWLYHNAHRPPPPPQSRIAPISPFTPATPVVP